MSFRRCKNVVELVISTLCCTAAASALAYALLLEWFKHMMGGANLHVDLLRGRDRLGPHPTVALVHTDFAKPHVDQHHSSERFCACLA